MLHVLSGKKGRPIHAEYGDKEFVGKLDLSKFEPLPEGCTTESFATDLRYLPSDFVVQKCTHVSPFTQWKDFLVVIGLHANCATGNKSGPRDRALLKTQWLNMSGVWFV